MSLKCALIDITIIAIYFENVSRDGRQLPQREQTCPGDFTKRHAAIYLSRPWMLERLDALPGNNQLRKRR